MTTLIVIGQMIVLFAMMAIGYFSSKKGIITDSSGAAISKLTVNVFNPMLVLSAVLGQSDSITGSTLRENLILTLLYYAIVIALSFLFLFILRPEKGTKNIYVLLTTFGNIGFTGIPVIKGIYGNEAVLYVSFYILCFNILVYTYGMFLARRSGAELNEDGAWNNQNKTSIGQTIKQILNPGVITCILSLIILFTGISLPGFVATYCDYMGNATIPLSMIMVGVSVAKADLKAYIKDIRLFVFILIKMVIVPIAAVLILRGINMDPVVEGVFVLELSMPCATIIGLMVANAGGNSEYCMKGTVITNLFSIITISIIGLFL